jgi:hypothetical protein
VGLSTSTTNRHGIPYYSCSIISSQDSDPRAPTMAVAHDDNGPLFFPFPPSVLISFTFLNLGSNLEGGRMETTPPTSAMICRRPPWRVGQHLAALGLHGEWVSVGRRSASMVSGSTLDSGVVGGDLAHGKAEGNYIHGLKSIVSSPLHHRQDPPSCSLAAHCPPFPSHQ